MATTQDAGAFVQCAENRDAAGGGLGCPERGECDGTGNSVYPARTASEHGVNGSRSARRHKGRGRHSGLAPHDVR